MISRHQRASQKMQMHQAASDFMRQQSENKLAGHRNSEINQENSLFQAQQQHRRQMNQTHIVKGSKGKRSTAGLIVGKGSEFLSLKTQQEHIERELTMGRSGNEVTPEESQAANAILRHRMQRGVTTNASSAKQMQANMSQYEKNVQKDPSLKRNAQRKEFMQSLDRKQTVPKEEYSVSGAISIEDSPYKNLYQQIGADVMGEGDETAAPFKYNKRLYQTHARKDEPKELHHYERLRPSTDFAVALTTQPKIFNLGSEPGQQSSEVFHTRDFPDRNISLKQNEIKLVASEESLDDWYAQSLGIPYEKLLRQKRLLKQLMAEEAGKQKQTITADSQKKQAQRQDRFKKKNPRRQAIKSAFDSRFTKQGLPFSRASINSTQVEKAVPQSKGHQKRMSHLFNQMVENERQKRPMKIIKSPQELKPFVFPRNSRERSHVVDLNKKDKENQPANQQQTKKAVTIVEEAQDIKAVTPQKNIVGKPTNVQQDKGKSKSLNAKSFEDIAAKSLKTNKWPHYWTKDGMQKSQLLREIGGFNQKEYLLNFYTGMLVRKEDLKNGPRTLQGPDEEFLQKQKKKLRDLMFRNSEIENRKQLQMQEHYAKLRAAKEAYKPQPKHQAANQQADTITFHQKSEGAPNNVAQTSIPDQEGAEFDIDDEPSNVLLEPYKANDSFDSKIVLHSQQMARRPHTGFRLQVQHGSRGRLSQEQHRRSVTRALSSQRSLHDSAMNEEERQNLQKFWITGPSFTNKQHEKDAQEVTLDTSHNWHLRKKSGQETQQDYTTFQLQSMTQAQQEVADQTYKDLQKDAHRLSTIIQKKSDKPWVELSHNEQKYLQINSSMKGLKISSQYHKQLTRLTQEQCFHDQKNDIIQLMLSKKNVCGEGKHQLVVKKRKRKAFNQDSSAISSTETKTEDDAEEQDQKDGDDAAEDEMTKSQSMYNMQFSEKDIPHESSARQAYIMKQVELDNYRDIEDPFVCLTKDNRVNKVEIRPKVAVPTEDHRKTRLNFQDADFWYLKGYDHAREFEMDSAIDSYRQAIRLATSHSAAMINLAAQYELQQRYELATKWYKIAMVVNPDELDAYYGYALCKFKDGDCQDAIDHLSIAVEKLDGKDIKKRAGMHLVYFRYLRSMCYRVQGDFKRSQKDYRDILRAFELTEGSKFAKNIFAMILMPMETNRKKLLQYVEQFRGILDLYEADNDRRQLSQYYLAHMKDQFISDNKNPKWHDKRLPEVIKTLRKRQFFCRLSLKRIVEIVEKMELQLVQKRELLFFRPDKVYIIISGNILMKNHEQNILLPMTCAKFSEGDVLNYLQDKSELYHSLETWFFAQVQSEVVVLDRDYFEDIWYEDILTEDIMLKKSLVCTYPMFKSLSELTTLTLVSEVFQIRKFKKGEVIILQSKYSPTNSQFRQYYEVRLSKFAEELKQKRSLIEVTKERNRKKAQKREAQKKMLEDQKQAYGTNLDAPSRRPPNLHEASAATVGSFTSDNSSPSRTLKAKDLEDLNKATATAQLFNYESMRKKRIEKRLGIADQSQGTSQDRLASPNANDAATLQLISKNSELRMTRQLNAFRKKEQMRKEDEAAAKLRFSKNSRCEGGFYLIKEGYCQVVNRDDQYRAKLLKKGDFFGESDLLQCVGYSFFGEIVADSDDVECWFIPEEKFIKIPLFEQIHMKQYAENRRDVVMMSFDYSKRYKLDMREYQSYFGH